MTIKLLVCTACLGVIASGCSVSVTQMEQHGFYSESFTQEQVNAARTAGRVKNLGEFDIMSMGCGDYTQEAQDQNIVRPAVLKQLRKMGGNAAENVALHDRPANFFVGWLVVPLAAGCTGFEITGDALKVEQSSDGRQALESGLPTALDNALSKACDDPAFVAAITPPSGGGLSNQLL